MNINNKHLLYFLLGAFFLVFAYVVFVFFIFNNKKPSNIEPVLTPTPTIIKFVDGPSFPPELQREKILEGNYAKERQEFLKDKPWFLKLPFKSDNYFIIYSPEDGNFIASIYYFSSSNVSKEQQVSQAKQDVLKALNNNGVDLFKESVEFIEVKRD